MHSLHVNIKTFYNGLKCPVFNNMFLTRRWRHSCYRILLDELITTDIPGYRNFTRMEPTCFYLIEERIAHHLRKSTINFRKPLEVGLKLAVIMRHLFQHEYLIFPTDPEDWKKIGERFRNRWNVSHAGGALDGKHIHVQEVRQ